MTDDKGIIFVTSLNLTRHSAAVINIMQMCNAFAKSGARVILLAPAVKANAEELLKYYRVEHPFQLRGVRLPEIFTEGGMPGRSVLFAMLSAGLVLRLARAYTVYSRDPWVFSLLAFLTGKRCFLEMHQFRFHSRLHTFAYRCLVKLAMKRENARMVCISASLMNQWESCGIDRAKMTVAHDAANPDHYAPLTKDEARQEVGLPTNRKVVVYTGSLLPSKGVDVLVKCANRLPEVTFVVVGGEKSQIDELRKLSLADNVVFTGHSPPEKVPVYQAAADVLALPNTRGSVIDDVTSPMKLFEYMAAGRPIVASDMPTLLEVLRHDSNALISPAGDDRELSLNVQRLLSDPALGARLAANSKNDLSNYTWDSRVSRITALLPTQP